MWLSPRSAAVSPRESSGRHDHLVADAETLDPFSDLRDHPGHLVAYHLRHLDAPVHRAVRNVQICSADATVGHVEPYFPRPRLLQSAVPGGEQTAAFVVNRAHVSASPGRLALFRPR